VDHDASGLVGCGHSCAPGERLVRRGGSSGRSADPGRDHPKLVGRPGYNTFALPVVAPNGNVTTVDGVNSSGSTQPADSLIRTTSTDGLPVWSKTRGYPTATDFASATPVVDPANVTYLVRHQILPDQRFVEAFGPKGQQLWSTPLSGNGCCGSYGDVAINLGADGLIWVVETDATNHAWLEGFDRATGSAVKQITPPTGFDTHWWSTYSTGLVMLTAGGVQWFDYQGALLATVPIGDWAIANNPPEGSAFSADGTYFRQTSQGDGCNSPNYIQKFTPAGVAWSQQLDPAIYGCIPAIVVAMPDGGVALRWIAHPELGVSVLNADGSARWSRASSIGTAVPNVAAPYQYVGALKADESGALIYEQGLYYYSDPQHSALTIAVTELDPNTGAETNSAWIPAANLSAPENFHFVGFSTAPDHMYVAASSDIGGFPNGEDRLWSFAMPGLTGEYPSTVIRGLVTPVGPNVSSVGASVGPKTPLWKMNLAVAATGLACPSTLKIHVGQAVGGMNYGATVCKAGGTAPPVITVPNAPVFTPPTAKVAGALIPGGQPGGNVQTWTATYTDPFTRKTSIIGSGILQGMPEAPVWVAVGDSYSSGHHQDADSPLCLTEDASCGVVPNDSNFSWVRQSVDSLNTSHHVPDAWLMTPDVVALSGAASSSFGSQAMTMTVDLTNRRHSWNVVSIDGGANDIQFGAFLAAWYASNATAGIPGPWAVAQTITTPAGARQVCPRTDLLYSVLQPLASTITANLQGVIDSAVAASPGARIVDISYPYTMDTTSPCARSYSKTILGIRDTFQGATALVNSLDSIHTALTAPALYRVDLRTSLGLGTTPLGYIQRTRIYGYPHPSAPGQARIAALAALRVR
jgi:hypothetical protein